MSGTNAADLPALGALSLKYILFDIKIQHSFS
jgi:hypothetical protein